MDPDFGKSWQVLPFEGDAALLSYIAMRKTGRRQGVVIFCRKMSLVPVRRETTWEWE